MQLNNLGGVIERRLLLNYRVAPDVAAGILPPPFEPSLVDGYAIAGICLLQLNVRPTWLPGPVGFRSLNGAHRVAVTLPDGSDAVYIPRRDTNSRLNHIVGGRLFSGPHHKATISLSDSRERLRIELRSDDGLTSVRADVSPAERLPADSVFDSLDHVSAFFESGSVGYSTRPGGGYDELELRTDNWSVEPVHVETAESSFFDDPTLFPVGSAELDNALVMRDIRHTWHSERSPATPGPATSVPSRSAESDAGAGVDLVGGAATGWDRSERETGVQGEESKKYRGGEPLLLGSGLRVLGFGDAHDFAATGRGVRALAVIRR